MTESDFLSIFVKISRETRVLNLTCKRLNMENAKIKIGFLSHKNPDNRVPMSGTTYKMNETLKSLGYDVVWIEEKHNIIYFLNRWFCYFYAALTRSKIKPDRTRIGAWSGSMAISRKKMRECDLLFLPFEPSFLYGMKPEKPLIYASDATFQRMIDYYYKNMPTWARRQGIAVDKRAMERATLSVFSSNWSMSSAITDYGVPFDKVRLVEFGANLDEADLKPRPYKYDGELRLVFIGVDWKRKGGKIAVDAVDYLYRKGYNVMLAIIGGKGMPDRVKSLPYVKYYGFLNKNDKFQYDELVKIMKDSHAMLLPTRAECSAIVYCEASAMGIPIFTCNTGGVSNYIYNGTNGYMLSPEATGEDYGRKIDECMTSGEMEKMSGTAPEVYKAMLNWNGWGLKMNEIIHSLLSGDKDD